MSGAGMKYSRTVCGTVLVSVWIAVIGFVVSSSQLVSAPEPIVSSESSHIDSRWYYLMLVPMYVPVIVVVAYLNWLGIKFFRHN